VVDVTAVEYRKGYSITLAPLRIKNLVIIGMSGGNMGFVDSLDAYDAGTATQCASTLSLVRQPGHETWKATRGKSEARRRDYGDLRSATNTTFLTTGNPSLRIAAKGARATISTVIPCSLSIRRRENSNGYFQFSKRDDHDMTPRRCLSWLTRRPAPNPASESQRGFLLIDRSNGKLVFREPF